MADDATQIEQEVRRRAEFADLPIRLEDMDAIIQGWELIKPHLACVLAENLPPSAEPAALFRP